VLIGIAIGIPILILFRTTGRPKCWRCHVYMLPVRRRVRKFALLPFGSCEGCGVMCLALGPRTTKKKKKRRGA
jgi:hypothetical protein